MGRDPQVPHGQRLGSLSVAASDQYLAGLFDGEGSFGSDPSWRERRQALLAINPDHPYAPTLET